MASRCKYAWPLYGVVEQRVDKSEGTNKGTNKGTNRGRKGDSLKNDYGLRPFKENFLCEVKERMNVTINERREQFKVTVKRLVELHQS